MAVNSNLKIGKLVASEQKGKISVLQFKWSKSVIAEEQIVYYFFVSFFQSLGYKLVQNFKGFLFKMDAAIST